MRKQSMIVHMVLAGMLFAGMDARALQTGLDVSAADARELYNYTLTLDKIQKTAAATEKLTVLAKQHPEVNAMQDAKSIDDSVQKINKFPDAVAVIRQSGLTPHEYVVCIMTLIQASMAVGFKKSGTYKDYPPEILKQVSKPNLDFTEQHWDDIQKLTQSMNSDQ